MAARELKIIKPENGKPLASQTNRDILRLEELRAKLQDARRRLNTVDEIIQEACEMMKT